MPAAQPIDCPSKGEDAITLKSTQLSMLHEFSFPAGSRFGNGNAVCLLFCTTRVGDRLRLQSYDDNRCAQGIGRGEAGNQPAQHHQNDALLRHIAGLSRWLRQP